MLWYRLRLTLDMIKFEHSVFALPFALTGALLAFRQNGFDFHGVGSKLLWIVVAMVAARSAAMAFNRVVDADIDSRNPRTKMRHLPAGLALHRIRLGFCSRRRSAFFVRCMRIESAVLSAGAVGAGNRSSSTRSPSGSRRSRTWCWDSAWASRRPPLGLPYAARSTRAFSGSPRR